MRKYKNYHTIKPNDRCKFEMLYYHSIRVLNRLEKLIQEQGNCQLERDSKFCIDRIQKKIEQMVAKWESKTKK